MHASSSEPLHDAQRGTRALFAPFSGAAAGRCSAPSFRPTQDTRDNCANSARVPKKSTASPSTRRGRARPGTRSRRNNRRYHPSHRGGRGRESPRSRRCQGSWPTRWRHCWASAGVARIRELQTAGQGSCLLIGQRIRDPCSVNARQTSRRQMTGKGIINCAPCASMRTSSNDRLRTTSRRSKLFAAVGSLPVRMSASTTAENRPFAGTIRTGAGSSRLRFTAKKYNLWPSRSALQSTSAAFP